jgi:hypothetical protein
MVVETAGEFAVKLVDEPVGVLRIDGCKDRTSSFASIRSLPSLD